MNELTNKTPDVNFNADNGILTLKGRSIPENAKILYIPIIEWLVKYSKKPNQLTVLHIKLEYFNSSSIKYIFDIMKILEKIQSKDTNVNIKWYYEDDDDDLLSAGEDFISITELSFEMVKTKDLYKNI